LLEEARRTGDGLQIVEVVQVGVECGGLVVAGAARGLRVGVEVVVSSVCGRKKKVFSGLFGCFN
jgi:hypothetical protein